MKKVFNSKFAFIFSGLFLMCLVFCAVYCLNFFFPNQIIQTTLGNIDVGCRNKDFLYNKLISQVDEYDIVIVDKDNVKNNFKLSDFYEIDEEKLNNLLQSKSYLDWYTNNEINIADFSFLSREKIERVLNKIRVNEDIQSESAYILLDEENKIFEIVPEVYGNEYVSDLVDIFENDFSINKQEYNLSDLNGYILPIILQDNEDLQKELKDRNAFLETVIDFKFGESIERVDKNIYFDWITFKENDKEIDIEIDESPVNTFVEGLTEKYDTLYKNREFKTSTNEIVSLSTGTYGWVLDKEFIYNTLIENILKKQSGVYDFKYIVTASVYDSNDIGNTYVEVSIDNQKAWMYKNGECIVETPIVTGCVNSGHNTRKGVFTIYYKAMNVVLRGPGYASPVTFWMPFDGGIGLHDASWRDTFGGTIYQTNGSHGCVNMPYDAAKTIYENIDTTVPIIVW